MENITRRVETDLVALTLYVNVPTWFLITVGISLGSCAFICVAWCACAIIKLRKEEPMETKQIYLTEDESPKKKDMKSEIEVLTKSLRGSKKSKRAASKEDERNDDVEKGAGSRKSRKSRKEQRDHGGGDDIARRNNFDPIELMKTVTKRLISQ